MTNRNLASERVRYGLTQEEAASKFGCTVKSLSLYENGSRMAPSELITAAADLFGCSTDYLLGRTDERLPRATA